MKKTLVAFLALCLIMAGAALAIEEEEVITPEDSVYDAARLIEDAQYNLTEDSEEKAMIQNEFARRRFQVVRELAGKNAVLLREALKDLETHERELGRLIDDVANPDVILLVTEASEMRGQNLLLMSQNEDLPEEARQGMLKALANQEMAMERFRAAMEKAGLNREQGKDNGQTPVPQPTIPGPPAEKPKGPQGNR